MKSYSEIQQRIQELSDELNELSCDLSELMAVQPKQSINLSHITAAGASFPLNGHYLTEQEHKLQNAYLTLLIAVAMQSENAPEAGLQQVQRILSGIAYGETLERLVIDASILKEDQICGLAGTLHENSDAIEPWLFDAVLLCIAGGNSEKQREFLAGIAALIGAQEVQMKNMAALAVAINNQDLAAIKKCWENTDFFRFYPYLAPRGSETLIFTHGGKIMLIGDGKTPISDKMYESLMSDVYDHELYICSAVFENRIMNFGMSKYLHMKGCTIRGRRNYGERAFEVPYSGPAEISDCVFSDGYAYKTFFYISAPCKICNVQIEKIESRTLFSFLNSGKIELNGLRLSQIKTQSTWMEELSPSGARKADITVTNCIYHDCGENVKGWLALGFREV